MNMAFSIAWLSTVVIFGVFEAWAILGKHQGGTLSEHIRRILGIYPHKWWRPLGIAFVVGFSVWFPLHIIFEQ